MFQLARRSRTIDIWPGFVDALASVLLVFIFMLLLFVLAQFYASWELAGREATISRLQRSVNELAETLALERDRSASLESQLADTEQRLRATLADRDDISGRLRLAQERAAATEADLAEARRVISADKDAIRVHLAEIASLQQDIAALRELREKLEAQIAQRDTELTAQRDRSKQLEARLASEEERTRLAQTEIDKRDIRITQLTQQVTALRRQLAELTAALKLAEAKVGEQKLEIEGLGKRLNLALARKVQELNRYRSEFFGRLREVLGDRDDIRIVGDRFVFQSEVLFDTGSAELGAAGQRQLQQLARALQDVSARIPADIDWVLRVDGHTDRRPIHTQEFPSNWELSVARALSIVRFLIAKGIPAQRLIAAGFGEYHPLDPANTPAAWRRNRRIELRLTVP